MILSFDIEKGMRYCEGRDGLDSFLFELTDFVTGQDLKQLWVELNCEALGCSPRDGVFQTMTDSSPRRRGAALAPCKVTGIALLSHWPLFTPLCPLLSLFPVTVTSPDLQWLHVSLPTAATQFSALPRSIFPPLWRGRSYSPNLIQKTQQRKSDLAKITHPAGGCINSVYNPDQSSQIIDWITNIHFHPGFWSLALDAFFSFACSANSSFGCFRKPTYRQFGIFTDSSGKSVWMMINSKCIRYYHIPYSILAWLSLSLSKILRGFCGQEPNIHSVKLILSICGQWEA